MKASAFRSSSIHAGWRPLPWALLSVLLPLVLCLGGAFEFLELKTLDARFWLRGSTPPPAEVVIVGIDDESMNAIDKQWPWPRSLHATVVRRLSQWGAATICFDVIFSEPSEDPDEDRAFAAAISQAGNVILAQKITRVRTGRYVLESVVGPIPQLAAAAWGLGVVNHPYDPDQFIRRANLLHRVSGQIRPAFPLVAAAHYRGLPKGDLGRHRVRDGKTQSTLERADAGELLATLLGQVPPLSAGGLGRFPISTLINYSGPPRTVRTVPYYQVLEGVALPDWFAGKLVFIGYIDDDISADASDAFPTPFFASGGVTPGVEIHANAAATLLQGSYIRRVRPAVMALILLLTGVSFAALTLRCAPLTSLLGSVLVLLAYSLLALALFLRFRFWLDIVPIAGTMVTVYPAITASRLLYEEQERRRIRSLFGRYVSEEVVQEILRSGQEVAAAGRRQEVTILFSDIRNFTTMSESMQPEQVVAQLNEFLTEMTEVIFEHGGTVDKFVGDCIMALFGAPLPHPNAAESAVRAALQMQQRLRRLQEKWQAAGKPLFAAGIGINTGEVVVGNIGSPRRLDYTVIGDNVNLAARLESLTKEYQKSIIISEATYNQVAHLVHARPLGAVPIRGRKQPVHVYEVIALVNEESNDSKNKEQ